MAHRGPGMRTPRTRALEIGTDSAGFDGANFNPDTGLPSSPLVKGGKYEEQPPQVSAGGAKPINPPTPFKIGGNPY